MIDVRNSVLCLDMFFLFVKFFLLSIIYLESGASYKKNRRYQKYQRPQ